MDETMVQTLQDRLRKLEALHAGTTSDGERAAAQAASERIKARLDAARSIEREIVLRYTLADPWNRRLFVALCRRYGLKPYREYRQRLSSVMVRAPETFQRDVLLPEFKALAADLQKHLEEITDRAIREVIDSDVSEAVEDEAPKALPDRRD